MIAYISSLAASSRQLSLLIRTTVLHDLYVLAIRRTMQINSRPTEIIMYYWKEVAICVDDEFDSYES